MREWRVLNLPVLRRRAPGAVAREPLARPSSATSRAPALAAVIQGPQGDVTVVATHLTFIPGWSTRAAAHARLARLTALPRPLVLMGDLNIGGDRPAARRGQAPVATAPPSRWRTRCGTWGPRPQPTGVGIACRGQPTSPNSDLENV